MFEIGSSLREARTRQGLDFEEMETRTKVRAKYLRFLEDERFEQLPGHTYTKGFLRVYADALGLDGRLYIDEYNSRYVAGDDDAHPGRPVGSPQRQRARDPRRDRRRRSGESRTVVVALAGILLLTLLVIAAWRFGGSDVPPVEGVELVQPPAEKPSAQTITVLVRAARGPSFVQVRAADATGTPLFTGTLERGKVQRFTGKGFELYVAKPGNVVVLVDGERQALSRSGRLSAGAAALVK
jgi:cytoskeletal protein RodZ